MNEYIKQYRPTETEENRLFALKDWIDQDCTKNQVGEYTVSRISTDILISWEDIERRKELCTKSLEDTKKYLSEKYYANGQLSKALVSKILNIKDSILPDVYNHCLQEAKNPSNIYYKHLRQKYYELAMIEAGVLPRFFIESFNDDIDIDKACDEFINKIFRINKLYQDLMLWMSSLKPSDEFDEEGIDQMRRFPKFYIHSLELYINDENPVQKVINELTKRYNKASLDKSQIDIDDLDELLTKKSIGAKLYPNQEKFYKSLEQWASYIKNPKCKEWIINYLSRGRELPFYKIKVFKFMKEPEKAKEFLINEYEKILKLRFEKDLNYKKKNEKYRKIKHKKTLTAIKKYLKDSDKIGFNENDNEDSENRCQNSSYSLGYEGSWAHDVEGYSNDDIDTIFDGDPDAYWNID